MISLNTRTPGLTLDAGVKCNGEFTFMSSSDNSECKLQVIKEETVEQTYRIAILYLGLDRNDGRSSWTVKINDQIPRFSDSGGLSYCGSKKFHFIPAGNNIIEIQETDEHCTGSLWIDMSDEGCDVSQERPTVDERILALVAKGKIFKPEDGKQVKKIFFNNSIGVFLYARDQQWKTSIYFAKESEEFSKCESKMQFQCKCPSGDSGWDIKIPGDETTHMLEFAQGAGAKSGHGSETTWDKRRLKVIALE